MRSKQRIEWIDVAKFIGIFAIYIGHFGEQVGRFYPFVFLFLPLFFFLSGCIASLRGVEGNTSLKKYIGKKFKSILVPYYVFVVLSVILYIIQTNGSPEYAAELLFDGIIKGAVRNHFPAGTLWFLTCLFVMEILFECLRRIMNRYFVLFVCMLLHVFYLLTLEDIYPFLWYNIDSVACYTIYYAVGFCIFPKMIELFLLLKRKDKVIFTLTGVIAFVYSALVYGGHYLSLWIYDNHVLDYLPDSCVTIICDSLDVAGNLITIYLVLVISRLLVNVKFFQEIGRNTLYLCGNEYIIKTIASCFVGVFGISISFPNPFSAYMYALALLVICNKYLVPIEKPLVQWTLAKLESCGRLLDIPMR